MDAVFVDCTDELRSVIAERGLRVPAGVRINHGSPSAEELVGLCQGRNAILVEHTVVPPWVFEACPTVGAVVFMGTGAGTYVDLEDAARRNIRVLTTPGYGDRAVAEHAFALMFAAARSVARMDREVRAGRWIPRGGLQLRGRRAAVIGLGGIGTEFAAMARAIGMDVRAWNRTSRDVEGYVADLDTALGGAEVVSLHLALDAATAGILGRARLRLPAPGYILVNTARAGLVDQQALIEALDDGHVGHAGLDVFPDEPLPEGDPCRARDDVTMTAHAAYMTDDAYAELWRRAVAALESLGRSPRD